MMGFMHKLARAALLIAAFVMVQLPAHAQVQPPDPTTGSPGVPGALERRQNADSREDRTDRGARASDVNVSGPSVFEPTALGPNSVDADRMQDREERQENLLGRSLQLKPPPLPNEFETYVEEVVGRKVPRFGQELLLASSRDFAAPATAAVPPEYRLNVGDTVVMFLTGSVSGTVEREIDNDGNIFLPSIGQVKLAGVRYADLRAKLMQAIGSQYRFFEVNVTIKALRGVRVYVTGFANNPGAFTLTSLATVTNAVLQAGGPAAGGSFRTVKVYRNGREVGNFDLYRLLRGGNRDGDLVLQNEDVLFIPPAGEQVAVIGSVQEEAIYELLPGESLADAVRLAGGPNVLADPDRVILYRTADVTDRQPLEFQMAAAQGVPAKGGDLIEMLSRGSLVQPIARQSLVVRIEGEVARPGNYYVRPNTSLDELLAMAGGVTDRAYLFGSRLERFSVRKQQQASFDEAVEQFRLALAAAPLEGGGVDDNPARRAAELESARAVLEELSEREPDGRVVLDIAPRATALPAGVLLEQNDRLLVPPLPSTIGVFGAVYRPASFLVREGSTKLRSYIEQAGGPLRSADRGRMFVVRANGEVLTRAKGMMDAPALPGDVVFVPTRTRSNNLWTQIREISSIVFQLGLTAAFLETLR
jgi:protein involved in polysaccharide export with SLBB domain